MNGNVIFDFMCNNKRFEKTNHERHWYLLNEDGTRRGFIWFKHCLGGWRLKLLRVTNDEWEKRGVIDSINKLTSFY